MHRSPNLAQDDQLEPESGDLQEDICGRHFLFDEKCKKEDFIFHGEEPICKIIFPPTQKMLLKFDKNK